MNPKHRTFNHIELSDERRDALASRLMRHVLEEHDEEISAFRARKLIEFFLVELGPPVYNQAIQDARGFLQERLDDLDAEFFEPESGAEG